MKCDRTSTYEGKRGCNQKRKVVTHRKHKSSERKCLSKQNCQHLEHEQVISRNTDEDVKMAATGDAIFPSCTPWLVVVATLTFRIMYVLDPDNWWILHPDEIFQSMEGIYCYL